MEICAGNKEWCPGAFLSTAAGAVCGELTIIADRQANKTVNRIFDF
jgi:hypothetical protein